MLWHQYNCSHVRYKMVSKLPCLYHGNPDNTIEISLENETGPAVIEVANQSIFPALCTQIPWDLAHDKDYFLQYFPGHLGCILWNQTIVETVYAKVAIYIPNCIHTNMIVIDKNIYRWHIDKLSFWL